MRKGKWISGVVVGLSVLAAVSGAQSEEMQRRASNIIGATVANLGDEELGTVEDLIIEGNDEVVAAILSVGGFLGIGDKLVAVPYEEIQFTAEETVVFAATKESLELLPAYEEGQVALALERAAETVDEATEDLRTATAEKRTEYEAKMEQTLSDWENKLSQLRQGSTETASDAEDEVQEAWTALQERWSDLRDASGDAWDDTKQAVDEGVQRLENAWDSLTKDS